jgi:hypothetical protein
MNLCDSLTKSRRVFPPVSETSDQREANKRAAQQIYDVWDGGDEDALDEVIAEDVVFDNALGKQVVGDHNCRSAVTENPGL